jgi:hypothetical protein
VYFKSPFDTTLGVAMLPSHDFSLDGIATHRQGSINRPGILRGEAQQLSIERRMNQVKAALSNAIKRHSQDLVTR